MEQKDYILWLPDEVLGRIFNFVEPEDWIQLNKTCRRFYTVTNNNHAWQRMCGTTWNISAMDPDVSDWKGMFGRMYSRYGPYMDCYSRVSRCWDTIFSLTHARLPPLYTSLRRNLLEENGIKQFEKLQELSDVRLPLEFRCSYRICDGQNMPFCPDHSTTMTTPFGLIGSYDGDDEGEYMCSLHEITRLLGLNCPAGLKYASTKQRCCLKFIIFSKRISHTIGGAALCLRKPAACCPKEKEHSRLDGCVVSAMSPMSDDVFIYAKSFIEYLEDFAKKLTIFPVVNFKLLRFEPAGEDDTGPFTVSVATTFCRETSSAVRHFRFLYRITLRMRSDASERDSCKLETRHWTITDADGHVEFVNGPGVVGQFPIMRPGTEFSWISSTSFDTRSGTMGGYFTMRKLNATQQEVRINCPLYRMSAPDFVIL